MHSKSAHPLARLMGAAIPLVALALIACPEKKEETPTPAAVDSGAPAVAPAPAPAPEVDAGPAAAAPEADAGAAQAPAPGKGPTTGAKTGATPPAPNTGAMGGAKTGATPPAPDTGSTPGAKTGSPETGTATGAKTPDTGAMTGAKTPDTGSGPGAATGGATKAATEPDKKTQRTWKAKCASCHGSDGKADTEQGKKMKVEDMTTAAFQSHVTDAQMHKAIADGFKAPAGDMPAYGSELSPEQIDALVNYVRWVGKK